MFHIRHIIRLMLYPAELADLYVTQGLTTRAIADRCGVSHTTVKRWLKAANVAPRAPGRGLRHRGANEPTAEELHRLVYEEHTSYREIAALYGVDFTAVPHWLRKHGIQRPAVWETRRRGSIPDLPSREDLRALYEDVGLSAVEIARRVGVSGHVIRNLLKIGNIEVRAEEWRGERLPCTDGHQVRSVYELLVDEWLTDQGLAHSYEPALPFDRRMRADFLVGDCYIEVYAVEHVERYERRRFLKRRFYEKHGLWLIELPLADFKDGSWQGELSKLTITPHL